MDFPGVKIGEGKVSFALAEFDGNPGLAISRNPLGQSKPGTELPKCEIEDHDLLFCLVFTNLNGVLQFETYIARIKEKMFYESLEET